MILIVLPTKTSRRLLVVAIELKASVVVARTPTSRKTATLEMCTIGDGNMCYCTLASYFVRQAVSLLPLPLGLGVGGAMASSWLPRLQGRNRKTHDAT